MAFFFFPKSSNRSKRKAKRPRNPWWVLFMARSTCLGILKKIPQSSLHQIVRSMSTKPKYKLMMKISVTSASPFGFVGLIFNRGLSKRSKEAIVEDLAEAIVSCVSMFSSSNWETRFVQTTVTCFKKKKPTQIWPQISFLFILILILSVIEPSLNNALVQLKGFYCKLLKFHQRDVWIFTKFITLYNLHRDSCFLISFITPLLSNLPANSNINVQFEHQSVKVGVSEYDGAPRSSNLA